VCVIYFRAWAKRTGGVVHLRVSPAHRVRHRPPGRGGLLLVRVSIVVANHEAQDQEDQDKHGHQQRAEGIYKYLHPHPSGLRQRTLSIIRWSEADPVRVPCDATAAAMRRIMTIVRRAFSLRVRRARRVRGMNPTLCRGKESSSPPPTAVRRSIQDRSLTRSHEHCGSCLRDNKPACWTGGRMSVVRMSCVFDVHPCRAVCVNVLHSPRTKGPRRDAIE